jgi:hypothetical protein
MKNILEFNLREILEKRIKRDFRYVNKHFLGCLTLLRLFV